MRFKDLARNCCADGGYLDGLYKRLTITCHCFNHVPLGRTKAHAVVVSSALKNVLIPLSLDLKSGSLTGAKVPPRSQKSNPADAITTSLMLCGAALLPKSTDSWNIRFEPLLLRPVRPWRKFNQSM